VSFPFAYAPPSGGVDLLTIPKAFLAYVVAYLEQSGVTVPDRRYVGGGTPQDVAWDCEQVTITLAEVGWGRSRDATQLSPAFGKQASVDAMRHATYALTLVRCYPTIGDRGELPTLDDLEAAGEQQMIDAGLLSQAGVNFVAFPNDAVPPGASVQAGAVQPVGPAGGFLGLELALTATVATLNPPAPGQHT
jgi:hypothetical protein